MTDKPTPGNAALKSPRQRTCVCFRTTPSARCMTCPIYRSPRALIGVCAASATLDSNDPARRRQVWCYLPTGHAGAHTSEALRA